MKQNKGVSLILTLLIMSSILTGAVIVGDILIRHGQVVQGAEVSEMAYFAARSGAEKIAYKALKNYEDITNLNNSSGELDNGGSYDVLGIDTYATNPNTGLEINDSNSWSINLSPGETFHLSLDINGVSYPNSIVFSKSGSVSSDMVIFECNVTDGECSSNQTQSFDVDFSHTLSVDSNKNYEITIKNSGSSIETYVIEPNMTLPIGIQTSVKGVYSGYERQIKATFRKWQIYGG